jgi:hypothetical protein
MVTPDKKFYAETQKNRKTIFATDEGDEHG